MQVKVMYNWLYIPIVMDFGYVSGAICYGGRESKTRRNWSWYVSSGRQQRLTQFNRKDIHTCTDIVIILLIWIAFRFYFNVISLAMLTYLQDKSAVEMHKGHEFVPIHYRTPTTCDSCNKPVWHMLHPPQALECRRK